MTDTLERSISDAQHRLARATAAAPPSPRGRVRKVVGLNLEVEGLEAAIG